MSTISAPATSPPGVQSYPFGSPSVAPALTGGGFSGFLNSNPNYFDSLYNQGASQ